MKSLKNVRIGPKLLLAFMLMLAFAGVIGFVSIVQLSKVAREAEIIQTDALGSVSQLSVIRFNFASSRSAALELLTQLQLNYASGADASLASLAAVEDQILAGVAAFQPLIKTPEQRALWDDANAKWKDYKVEQERSIAVAQDGLAGDAQKILVGLAKAKFAKAEAAVSKLIDSANEQAKCGAHRRQCRRGRRTPHHTCPPRACRRDRLRGRVTDDSCHRSTVERLGGAAAPDRRRPARQPNRHDAQRRVGDLLVGLATAQTQLLGRATAEQGRCRRGSQTRGVRSAGARSGFASAPSPTAVRWRKYKKWSRPW